MAEVKHHFVGTLSLEEYYSAAQFEDDVMQLLPQLFARSPYVVMCGGSMMYVDAVCKGIDNIPTISDEIRREVVERFERDGAEAMREELRRLDPIYYNQVDLKNHKRVIHAVEICLQAGRPYSELRTNSVKQRPFRIVKIGLNLPREQLFDRINRRVEKMIEAGLVDEARRFYPQRHLNSLNTVGYKELFAWMDGTMDYDTAVARIQKNTRVYAKTAHLVRQRHRHALVCPFRPSGNPETCDGIITSSDIGIPSPETSPHFSLHHGSSANAFSDANKNTLQINYLQLIP